MFTVLYCPSLPLSVPGVGDTQKVRALGDLLRLKSIKYSGVRLNGPQIYRLLAYKVNFWMLSAIQPYNPLRRSISFGQNVDLISGRKCTICPLTLLRPSIRIGRGIPRQLPSALSLSLPTRPLRRWASPRFLVARAFHSPLRRFR